MNTARWISLALLVALVLLFRGPDWLPWHHGSSDLAFTSDRDGCCHIYVMDRDGDHIHKLTDMKGHSPAWSPDGQKILFVHRQRGTTGGGRDQEIYVMDADGGDPKRLTDNRVRDDDPTWSSDGRSIAFVRGPEWEGDVYVMDADGTHERRLTRSKAPELDPAWSPTGRLAFIRQSGGWSYLHVTKTDGGKARIVREIPTAVDSPTWSPDGRWIAFRQSKSIYRVGADGRRLERLFRGDNWIWQTAWSPDGTEIAFVSIINGGLVAPDFYEIHALDLDSGRERDVTNARGDMEPAWRP